MLKSIRISTALFLLLIGATLVSPIRASESKEIILTGEMIDTWCYVSQIMGSSEEVTGTAHHVCAVWCAAGGIPVGLLSKADNKVYMILSLNGKGVGATNDEILDLQSSELTVRGTTFDLDGLSYLNIDEIIEDKGIVNLTHKEHGIVPGNARP